MFDPPGVASVEGLLAARAELEAAERRWLEQVAAADRDLVWKADGAASMTAWLKRTCGLRGAVASAAVRKARFLARSSATAAAWEAGEVGSDHVEAMAREASKAPEEFDEVEAEMADIASRLSPDDVRSVLRHWRDLVDPDGNDPTDRHSRRGARWWKNFDGTLSGEFTLDELSGAEFMRVLERFVRREQAADEALPPSARRTLAQLRADALREMALAAAAHLDAGKPVSAQGPAVSLVLDIERLEGDAGRCDLDGVPVSVALAKEACCEGTLRRVVTAASVPIDVGTAVRFAAAEQRVALEVRDGGCVFAGCGRAARDCIAHHLIPWPDGPTDLANLALVCRHHHRLVHRGWRIERQPDGSWITTSPLGQVVGERRADANAA